MGYSHKDKKQLSKKSKHQFRANKIKKKKKNMRTNKNKFTTRKQEIQIYYKRRRSLLNENENRSLD